MNLSLLLVLRLTFAAVLGGVIGFEREWRAKEAGLRTHFLVAMGACLFMVVSQFGFDIAAVIAQSLSFLPASFTMTVEKISV